jgi:hypothetical protein
LTSPRGNVGLRAVVVVDVVVVVVVVAIVDSTIPSRRNNPR